ncbi:probable 28S ribosomal protein S16, mitochondrial [Ischnura elegans]|uniref:probable 28S ribosomal protein S16, mitochondrial n=1 Tax=Ischnura elegans TaxID=197161 RepID=UPI001ED8679D|nr:probable 28S ribosomal protein S16, mitochondrial [Ischnura elegans]
MKPGTMMIRFARRGCTNRPVFHIVVMDVKKGQREEAVEQVGVYDPLPNKYNEKLVSFNFDRIKYWVGHGAQFSTPVAELLGLAGFLPLHPRTIMAAWRNRLKEGTEEESESKESKETT